MMSYNPKDGLFLSSLRYRGTVIPMVLKTPEFLYFTALNLGVFYARMSGSFIPSDDHVGLSLSTLTISTCLMTFVVTFYSGNVFERYCQIYDLCMEMGETCLLIVHTLDRELEQKHVVRRLASWLIASIMIFQFERKAEPGDSITPHQWQMLCNLNLLSAEEADFLCEHCLFAGADARPFLRVMQWSFKLYRLHSDRVQDLDQFYITLDQCVTDIRDIINLPMPFQYFHFLSITMMLNVTLWAYSLALVDSFFAPFVFMVAQFTFMAVRELTVAMSLPFGTDVTDFPLEQWTSTLYIRIRCLVEADAQPAGLKGTLRPLAPASEEQFSALPPKFNTSPTGECGECPPTIRVVDGAVYSALPHHTG